MSHHKHSCGDENCPQNKHSHSHEKCSENTHGDTVNYIFCKNFSKDRFRIPKDFVYFSAFGYVADDGLLSTDYATGLTVTSAPFTKRGVGILDHTKWLAVTSKAFVVPTKDAELFVEAKMFFQATGIINGNQLASGIQKYSAGIQNVMDEPRLTCGALNLLDLQTGMVFDFIFSNETIYALYEHLPVTGDTAIFTYAIPVASRPTDLNTFQKFKIGYNGYKKEVSWYIDNTKVYSVKNPGLLLADRGSLVTYGGTFAEKEVKINQLSVGFGTFSLLDFFPFKGSYEGIGESHTLDVSNAIVEVEPLANLGNVYYKRAPDQLGNLVPQTSFIYNGLAGNDGQGGILTIKKIKVGIQYSECTNPGNYEFKDNMMDNKQWTQYLNV